MQPFSEYVSTLRDLVADQLSTPAVEPPDAVLAALDGQPSRELRRLVPLVERRADGAFFTGSALAKQVVAHFLSTPTPNLIVCDPACGAGDLLIAASQRLPIYPNLESTLRLWGMVLRGYDIHEQFIEATRLRLVLAAISRGARSRRATAGSLTALLSGIRVSNGLAPSFDDVNVVLVNPPYGSRQAPAGCNWASGLVSDAAVFTHDLVEKLPCAAKITAILPDVLRTGTRYAKWRAAMERQLYIDTLKVVGIFDRWADVDVFLLHAAKRAKNSKNDTEARWWSQAASQRRVRDKFEVNVGAVVPHRDRALGPWRKYIHARTISKLQTYDISKAPSRRFDRTTFRPPFVAIRRTSRPDDQIRAVATIILGSADVAVENHLIVASPRNGSLADCEALLEVLRHDSTTTWLNERIRCRHLTVGTVADIPWWDADSATAS
jgi:hypothetical protein